MARSWAALVFAVSVGAGGTPARAQAPPAVPPVAIRAARWIDVRTGKATPEAVVLVEGERITAVGSALPIPAEATVIDLGAATLLPGLIDCHTHLMMMLRPDESYGEHLLTSSEARRALEGAASARRTLRAGFTTVRDAGNEGSGSADVALRDAIGEGLVEGPRMQVATRGIAAVGQYHPFGVAADLPGFPTGAQMVSGVEEARRAVREQVGHGADLIKVYADWEYPTLTPAELGVIVEEAHQLHRKVAAHASTPEGIQNAVAAGVDSIEHGEDPRQETLEMMKTRGTVLVSTVGVLSAALEEARGEKERAYLQDRLERLRRTLKAARLAGVRIAGGMDASEERGQGRNARQLTTLVELGATPLEALQSATVTAADLLGWSDRIGTLEAGKLADVIALDGNPLEDIKALERVRFVMKGGQVVGGGR